MPTLSALMPHRQRKRTSKFLSLVLRHKPEAAGVTLDAHGWVAVDALLQGAQAAGVTLDRAMLDEVVRTSDKQRFAFSADGQRIRASQGHSVRVDLQLAPVQPPATLFHGTATRFLASIRTYGLRPGTRQHVHLSADATTATRVGQRHGTPVVLTVHASPLHAAGHRFFRSANGVWLTDTVPPDHLTFPE
ncbi:MAG: RNA 2'-phosphotransferase [Bacteroidota bacterium]